MNRILTTIAALALTGVASAAADLTQVTNTEAPYASLFGQPTGATTLGAGDTYSLEIMAQDATDAYYISDMSPSTHVFDNNQENAGLNLEGSGPLSSFTVRESTSVTASGHGIAQIEVAALDAAGDSEPWVAASNTGFTTWRLDVGFFDPIDFGPGFEVVDSGFTAFDSSGASIGSFGLTSDLSVGAALGGIAIIGLGGDDIAGFDVASIQMYWELAPVPGPGALALLGLAGVAARRRRRA